jgi:hypothetical protein
MVRKAASQLTVKMFPILIAKRFTCLTNSSFWILSVTLAVFHLYFLLRYKIDLPMVDEWADFATARNFSRDLNATWLLAPTNSHPMIFQRVLSWVFLIANGRNFRTQAIVQFLAYVPIVLTCLRLGERKLGVPLGWAAVLLFTALHASNFFWPFMFFLYIHFILSLVGIFMICSNRSCEVLSGYCIIAAAALQAGSGLATAFAVVIIGGFLAWRMHANAREHLIGIAIVVLTVAAWLISVPRDNPFVLENAPWTLAFWGFVGTVIAAALGVGYPRFSSDYIGYSVALGLAVLLIGSVLSVYVCLISGQLIERSRRARVAVGLFVASTSAVLLVGLGRPWEWGFFALRYHILGLQVVLAVLALIFACLQKKPAAAAGHRAVVSAIATVVVLLSLPNMRIKKHYESFGRAAIVQLQCARKFFSTPGYDSCENGPYEWGLEQGHIANSERLRANYCFSIAGGMPPGSSIEECYRNLAVK